MDQRIRVWRVASQADLELRRGVEVSESYPRHWHDEYQFCLIQQGGGELAYRGARVITPRASLFVVHPGEVHSNDTAAFRTCTFRSMYVAPQALQAVANALSGPRSHLPFFAQPVIFDGDVIALFERLHGMLEVPHTRLSADSLLLDLFAACISRYSGHPPPRSRIGGDRAAIRRIREYLTESYAESVSLEQLAELAGLSPFHLSRTFTKEVGIPPHSYQIHIRIERARTLLRQGHSIADVALLTGFVDQSHLTRHFKRLVKLTPGQYLQDSKNIQDGRPFTP